MSIYQVGNNARVATTLLVVLWKTLHSDASCLALFTRYTPSASTGLY